jgi:hypothetical protein
MDRLGALNVTLHDAQQGMSKWQLDGVAHECCHLVIAVERLPNELTPGDTRRTEYQDVHQRCSVSRLPTRGSPAAAVIRLERCCHRRLADER